MAEESDFTAMTNWPHSHPHPGGLEVETASREGSHMKVVSSQDPDVLQTFIPSLCRYDPCRYDCHSHSLMEKPRLSEIK